MAEDRNERRRSEGATPRPRPGGAAAGGRARGVTGGSRSGQRGGAERRGDGRSHGRRREAESPREGAEQALGRRKPWSAEGDLPRWIQEEIARVTPKQKVPNTVEFLQSAAKAFSAGKHGRAFKEAEEAKALSPRVATIRELLGLAAYRLGRWDVALRELRTFRRFTGETTHMPVEMDVLRALDRPDDVEETWASFRRLGGDRATEREARVVFASYLLDQGDDRRAWEITNPKRLGESPDESELRVWFVAARAAARLGDLATGRRIYEAIQAADPGFPGLDELDRVTSGR